jgi:hypothetical protein
MRVDIKVDKIRRLREEMPDVHEQLEAIWSIIEKIQPAQLDTRERDVMDRAKQSIEKVRRANATAGR